SSLRSVLFNPPLSTVTDTLSLHDALPICELTGGEGVHYSFEAIGLKQTAEQAFAMLRRGGTATVIGMIPMGMTVELPGIDFLGEDRKSTRLNSSHDQISYAVFCLKKKRSI